MTIRRNINASELSEQLSNFEACAQDAPAGTYEDVKKLNDFFADLHKFISDEIKALGIGLKVDNCDRYREVEAVLYGMLKDTNPDATMFAVGEGFGYSVTHRSPETRHRVIAQAASNLEFLKSVGVVK